MNIVERGFRAETASRQCSVTLGGTESCLGSLGHESF